MKPEFVLINWHTGSSYGIGSEDECRAQLEKILKGESTVSNHTFIIAEVKVRSQMKRIES